jgi:hypothetical protein
MAFLAASCGGSGSKSGSPPGHTAPLASLGALQPAPSPGKPGPEIVPIPDAPELAPAASKASPTHDVDGIKCQVNEPIAFHHHGHLTLFVNGKQRVIPAGIGVWPELEKQSGEFGHFKLTQGECLSWLVTRFADGIVHVEAPMVRAFTLGEFFDVWGQPLSETQIGPAQGPVTAIVNGRAWVGDPRGIPLTSHVQIQLEVGTPLVAQQLIEFPGSY